MLNKNMVTAAIVGVVILVISFNLFVPLNKATASLYNYFIESCVTGNSRFTKAFVGVSTFSSTAAVRARQYNTQTEVFGGPGVVLTNNAGSCQIPALTAAETGITAVTPLYNELGQQLGVSTAAAGTLAATDLPGGYAWYIPDSLLGDFIGIIRTLISLSPVLVVVGFVGLAGVGLVRYGMGIGTGGVVNAVSGSVLGLVINIVTMYLAPIGVSSMIEAGSYTQTGAHAVNQEFSGVQRLLFSVVPLILVVVTAFGNVALGALQYSGAGGRMMEKMKGGMSM